jgi:protein-serine/threonine kinase
MSSRSVAPGVLRSCLARARSCTAWCLLALLARLQPLAPANGAQADTTRDPMLRDKVHGAEILEMRKALAFAGFTHKSPRAIDYSRLTVGEIYPDQPTSDTKEADMDMDMDTRGRDTVRGTWRMRRGRALSM